MVVLKFMRFVLIIFAFLIAFFPIYINVSAFATEVSPIEKRILSLDYLWLKLCAINNGLCFYRSSNPDSKSMLKGSAQYVIDNLNNLNDELFELDLPKELSPTRDEFKIVIESLKKVYKDIDTKTDEKMKEDFSVFQKTVETYFKNLTPVAKKYMDFPELPEGFDVLDEELKYIKNSADREEFDVALDSMEKGKYTKANIILHCLLGGYRDSYFEGSILSRIFDCQCMMKTPDGYAVHIEYATNILGDFLKKKQYSPKLSEIFITWRTKYQLYYHGASNWSIIPNDEYIEMRWHVVKTIEEYLDKNPEDKWAKAQIIDLMSIPIIQRGGRFGNTNLNFAVKLFKYSNKAKESLNE